MKKYNPPQYQKVSPQQSPIILTNLTSLTRLGTQDTAKLSEYVIVLEK